MKKLAVILLVFGLFQGMAHEDIVILNDTKKAVYFAHLDEENLSGLFENLIEVSPEECRSQELDIHSKNKVRYVKIFAQGYIFHRPLGIYRLFNSSFGRAIELEKLEEHPSHCKLVN